LESALPRKVLHCKTQESKVHLGANKNMNRPSSIMEATTLDFWILVCGSGKNFWCPIQTVKLVEDINNYTI
jgi:hypothetical protein